MATIPTFDPAMVERGRGRVTNAVGTVPTLRRVGGLSSPEIYLAAMDDQAARGVFGSNVAV
jgi:hypothetical protein